LRARSHLVSAKVQFCILSSDLLLLRHNSTVYASTENRISHPDHASSAHEDNARSLAQLISRASHALAQASIARSSLRHFRRYARLCMVWSSRLMRAPEQSMSRGKQTVSWACHPSKIKWNQVRTRSAHLNWLAHMDAEACPSVVCVGVLALQSHLPGQSEIRTTAAQRPAWQAQMRAFSMPLRPSTLDVDTDGRAASKLLREAALSGTGDCAQTRSAGRCVNHSGWSEHRAAQGA
jgi:hypothetical protein